jgi:tRNA A-37 threonylcarbamoyl transferase component Bud32
VKDNNYKRSSNATSKIKIDKDRNLVTKTFSDRCNRLFKKFPKMFDREVYWLKKLSNSGITPKYISSNERCKSVTMEYAGEYLTKQNMPKDYEEQIKNIIDFLTQYQCSHNDIKPSELLILDDRIKLIDFGWSTKIGEPIPKRWPKILGDDHFRYKVHNFNDEYSLRKSIEWIQNET